MGSNAETFARVRIRIINIAARTSWLLTSCKAQKRLVNPAYWCHELDMSEASHSAATTPSMPGQTLFVTERYSRHAVGRLMLGLHQLIACYPRSGRKYSLVLTPIVDILPIDTPSAIIKPVIGTSNSLQCQTILSNSSTALPLCTYSCIACHGLPNIGLLHDKNKATHTEAPLQEHG